MTENADGIYGKGAFTNSIGKDIARLLVLEDYVKNLRKDTTFVDALMNNNSREGKSIEEEEAYLLKPLSNPKVVGVMSCWT